MLRVVVVRLHLKDPEYFASTLHQLLLLCDCVEIVMAVIVVDSASLTIFLTEAYG